MQRCVCVCRGARGWTGEAKNFQLHWLAPRGGKKNKQKYIWKKKIPFHAGGEGKKSSFGSISCLSGPDDDPKRTGEPINWSLWEPGGNDVLSGTGHHIRTYLLFLFLYLLLLRFFLPFFAYLLLYEETYLRCLKTLFPLKTMLHYAGVVKTVLARGCS